MAADFVFGCHNSNANGRKHSAKTVAWDVFFIRGAVLLVGRTREKGVGDFETRKKREKF